MIAEFVSILGLWQTPCTENVGDSSKTFVEYRADKSGTTTIARFQNSKCEGAGEVIGQTNYDYFVDENRIYTELNIGDISSKCEIFFVLSETTLDFPQGGKCIIDGIVYSTKPLFFRR